ncbi:zonular occludens toxin domain-containing protein, partial [Cupriavidus taiwanensis]|uniref:zonular occludens toxin domain-containing protein n=1 Tax=Cupriavidus taiwanensis TaxID=164546 RepID=UPI0015597DC8
VLPALNAGRKVITNLPLVLDAFPPEQRALLEIRTEAKGKAVPRPAGLLGGLEGDEDDSEVFRRAFATGDCYGDAWRHPDSGTGPLYVIDECHLSLPSGKALRKVREWYSMHRHEFADVLLITQSYGKVHRDIIDLVQVCYRVRKATAFGSNNGYIRKVFDGVKGDCVNTGVRKYDKRYFKFYKSHTKSSQAGQELAANDIVPLWKRWPFIGLGICVLLLVGLFASGKDMNPMKPPTPKKAPQSVATLPPSPSSHIEGSQPGAARKDEHGGRDGGAAPGRQQTGGHPFAGLGIHVSGLVRFQGKAPVYAVAFSQNGQQVFHTTSAELEEAGYQVRKISNCAMGLKYQDVEMVAVCDAPTVGVTPGEGTLSQKPKPEA